MQAAPSRSHSRPCHNKAQGSTNVSPGRRRLRSRSRSIKSNDVRDNGDPSGRPRGCLRSRKSQDPASRMRKMVRFRRSRRRRSRRLADKENQTPRVTQSASAVASQHHNAGKARENLTNRQVSFKPEVLQEFIPIWYSTLKNQFVFFIKLKIDLRREIGKWPFFFIYSISSKNENFHKHEAQWLNFCPPPPPWLTCIVWKISRTGKYARPVVLEKTPWPHVLDTLVVNGFSPLVCWE